MIDASMTEKPPLANVHDFWNTEACGTHFVQETAGTKAFYEKFREYRYRTEWHIPLLVPFTEARGKQVLEIGIGNGADGAMFALNGAHYTGVDLTEAALEATRRHFEVLELPGNFQRENAERLSFADGSFDWVYSHGVLHHTPHPAQAIREVWRVLKPGGRAIIMLYHKRSFNYYFRIMLYMRLRVLAKILSRFSRWKEDRAAACSANLSGVRGNQTRQVWEIHYQNFLRDGWAYLRADRFVHHGTDGPECPFAFAFTRGEASQLFQGFADIQFKVAHFPLRRYWSRFPLGLEKMLASWLGWYLFIYARKPA
ncbi:MAG: class I SAM-dependent methyltransferase [Verrucomicrobiota bacterium]